MERSYRRPNMRLGYNYLHCAVEGFFRLAYSEALEAEEAVTTTGFYARARAFFAAHGIIRADRVVTDNEANYRARNFTRALNTLAGRHQRIRPYAPRHNGNAERFNHLLVDEAPCARTYPSEQAHWEAIRV